MRSISRLFLVCFVGLSMLAGMPAAVHGDFSDLLKQVPDTANSVVLIKAKDLATNASREAKGQIRDFLRKSPNWPVMAPWKPVRIVMASEIDIQHMAPSWEMAAIEFERKLDIKQVAQRANGVLDKLAGRDVIWLDNACILVMGEKQLTLVTPLNRQSATRWLRRVEHVQDIEIAPYLAEMAKAAATDSAEITMVLDLENVFGPAQVNQAVARNPLFEKIQGDPAKIFVSIRGVTIRCNVGENEASSISVDFSESVGPLAPIAKTLMINSLVKMGAMLNEINSWKVQAAGNQISMEGQLSSSGLNRILNMTSFGSLATYSDANDANDATAGEKVAGDSKPKTDPSAKPGDNTGVTVDSMRAMRANRNYFRGVTDALDDITGNQDQPNLEQAALWINNHSRSIDQLSTRNVDPEMLAYGKWVAVTLRDIVYQFHQSDNQIQSSLSSTIPVIGETTVGAIPNLNRRVNYGGHVRYEYAPFYSQKLNIGAAIQERQAVRDTGVGEANEAAMSIFREIEKATVEMREYMTKKYGTQF